MRETLTRGWGARGRRQRELRSMLALAVDFHAWRALAQGGASDERAAELLSRLAACA